MMLFIQPPPPNMVAKRSYKIVLYSRKLKTWKKLLHLQNGDCEMWIIWRISSLLYYYTSKTISKIVHHKHITYEKRYYRHLKEEIWQSYAGYERMFDYILLLLCIKTIYLNERIFNFVLGCTYTFWNRTFLTFETTDLIIK